VSTSTTQSARKSNALNAVRRYPLISFFVLAFGLTWAIMVPQVLGSYGLIPFPELIPLLIVMGYGPTFAAVIMSAVLGGRSAVGELLGRMLIWRVGWRWWGVTLFLNAAVVGGALVLYAMLGNPLPPLPVLAPALVLDIVLTFVISGLINGEEIGWRGFATPRLLQRYGTVGTVAVLGTMQTLFHVPIFFNNGQSAAGGQNGMPFLAFAASVFGLVILSTWLYQNTRGSLLIATVFHASANTWTTIFQIPSSSPTFLWLMAGVTLLAAVIALATTWRRSANPSRSPAARGASVRP